MRKLIPVMLMFVLSLASCGKDGVTSRQKEEEEKVRTDIQGTWHISQMKVDGKYTSYIDTCIKLSYFKFIGSSNYLETNICTDFSYAGDFSINKNIVTIPAGKLKITYNIININGQTGEFVKTNANGSIEEFIATKKSQ